MKAICFNFEIHQPFRLKRYRFFDIGNDHYYFDDFLNDDIVSRVAHNSYIPACETLLRMVEHEPRAASAAPFAISGVALEQLEHYVPEFIDILKKLADTGCVEFVAQPLRLLAGIAHRPRRIPPAGSRHLQHPPQPFRCYPKVIRNTELIYDDDLAPQLVDIGFNGVLTEGAKHILGWKSPNYIYTAASAPDLQAAPPQQQAQRRYRIPIQRHFVGGIPPHRRQIHRLDCLDTARRADCQCLPQHGDIRRPAPCNNRHLPVPRGSAPASLPSTASTSLPPATLSPRSNP